MEQAGHEACLGAVLLWSRTKPSVKAAKAVGLKVVVLTRLWKVQPLQDDSNQPPKPQEQCQPVANSSVVAQCMWGSLAESSTTAGSKEGLASQDYARWGKGALTPERLAPITGLPRERQFTELQKKAKGDKWQLAFGGLSSKGRVAEDFAAQLLGNEEIKLLGDETLRGLFPSEQGGLLRVLRKC